MRHVLLVGTSIKVFMFVLLAEDGNANRMSDLWRNGNDGKESV